MGVNTAHRLHGWRMKIGKINPTTTDYPDNWTKMIPEGVKMVAVSSGAQSFDDSNMAGARERRRKAAHVLDEWGVDCVVAGGGPVSTLEGAEAEEEFIESVRAELSVPFVTSLKAQIDALRAIGAESVLAVTPFPADRDEETRAYLEDHGFDVVAIGGIDLPRPKDVRNLHPSTAYQCATSMADRAEADFDAVYVGCAPFGAVEYVERMESDIGAPVVLSAQAQLWKSFRLGGIDPDVDGFGSLFDH